MKITIEDIKDWYNENEYRWWTPDTFEDEICKDPLFPLMLSVFLKLNPEPRMITRMNIEFPDIDAGIYAEPYKPGLTKEEKKTMSKQDIDSYHKTYKNKPAELIHKEKDIMARTQLLDDARLCYLLFQHGLIYNPKTKEVSEPLSAIQRIELLPPQPIAATLDYYVYHMEDGCGVQTIAMNLGKEKPLRIYPDLSHVEIKKYSAKELVETLDVDLLSKEDATMLFEIVKSYPFKDHSESIRGLTDLFKSSGFEKLIRSMEIPERDAKLQVLQIQTWLPAPEIAAELSVQESTGVGDFELISAVYKKIPEPNADSTITISL